MRLFLDPLDYSIGGYSLWRGLLVVAISIKRPIMGDFPTVNHGEDSLNDVG